MRNSGQFCGRTRREFLWEVGGGFGAVALTGMLSADSFFNRAWPTGCQSAVPATSHGGKAKGLHLPVHVRRPQHIETFDACPTLSARRQDNPVKTPAAARARTSAASFSPRQFKKYANVGSSLGLVPKCRKLRR